MVKVALIQLVSKTICSPHTRKKQFRNLEGCVTLLFKEIIQLESFVLGHYLKLTFHQVKYSNVVSPEF